MNDVQAQINAAPVSEFDPVDARPPEFSDESLALQFAERHQSDLRYVAVWNKWLLWTGTHWRFDDTMRVFDLSRAICREVSAKCNKPNVAKSIASAKTIAAVVSLSRADRALAATVDEWDAGMWLLNTPSGVIDLRTGDRNPHRREDYLTKITAANPGDACPTWHQFLAQVTGGDQELQLYLQRVVGYALTGSIREHALFFLYGTGANGKGVFVNAIGGAMGDYHTTAPMDTFIASHTDRHPTDLASLRGARLVTAAETEEGRRWAESRIKALTGGDRIAARFMRQDFFEFAPQFKLLIAGNHKPGLRNVDEAIRRRFHLVPFTVTFPEGERDETLSDRLKSEWDGILAWMIEGAVEWGLQGLMPPEAVRNATAEYLNAEDGLARWIEECCVEGQTFTGTTALLFESWKDWCERTGEYAGSMKRFSQNIEARGYDRWQDPRSRRKGFRGLQAIRKTSNVGSQQ